MKFRLLTILFLFGALAQIRAQGNSIYSIAPMAVCWTTDEAVDSNLIAYWLFSSRETTPKVVSYLTASGTAVVVAGGTIQNGFCCCNSSQDTIGITINGDTLILVQNGITYTYIGGGGADDDWRWVDPAGDNMYQAIYREGKAGIFTQDTTYGFRVDSTYRFDTDNGTSTLEWMRGDTLVNYKTLMFRAPGGESGANGPNSITIASNTIPALRSNLGVLNFAAPYTGGGTNYRTAAAIRAVDGEGGNDTTNVYLDFMTRQEGETFMRNTMTIEGGGRIELDRYNLFQDGIPERFLGYENTDKDITVHNVGGNAQPGNVLGINGFGLEWLDPDTLGQGTNLTFTGSDSLITLNSSTGTDVNFVQGSNIELTQAGGQLLIEAVGLNGIYGGSDTIPHDVVATMTASSEDEEPLFRFNWPDGFSALSFLKTLDGDSKVVSFELGNGVFSMEGIPSYASATAELNLFRVDGKSGNAGQIGLREPSASGFDYIYFTAPVLPDTIGLTLPSTVGTSGQFLQTDGNNPAVLSWQTADLSVNNEGSLTVGAGTGTTSLINSNTSGSTPVTISASTGLAISEAGNTITLAPEAVTSDTVVLNGSWVNIGANKLSVHKRLGLVSIQGFIRGGTIPTILPGSPDAELPFGGFLVTNGFQATAYDDGVMKPVAVLDINGDLQFQSMSGGAIDLSGGSDYLYFSITYYNP